MAIPRIRLICDIEVPLMNKFSKKVKQSKTTKTAIIRDMITDFVGVKNEQRKKDK